MGLSSRSGPHLRWSVPVSSVPHPLPTLGRHCCLLESVPCLRRLLPASPTRRRSRRRCRLLATLRETSISFAGFLCRAFRGDSPGAVSGRLGSCAGAVSYTSPHPSCCGNLMVFVRTLDELGAAANREGYLPGPTP
jgi:hypothetical protein